MKIGIIGGSGLEDPDLIQGAKTLEIDTPYGKPSSKIVTGLINGTVVCILSRHGNKHQIMPTNVPNQANIHALNKLGCTHIIATTACGSLKEEIAPGHFLTPDQFIDRTTKRKTTFHEKDHVCHIPMGEPFCPTMRKIITDCAETLGYTCHGKGTVVTIEGPRFSTKAESNLFRSWGADVINMSTVPEVVLAREAGLHYAAIAMSTDYDCWRESTDTVNIDMVMRTFKENSKKVKLLIIKSLSLIQDTKNCKCTEYIKGAMIS